MFHVRLGLYMRPEAGTEKPMLFHIGKKKASPFQTYYILSCKYVLYRSVSMKQGDFVWKKNYVDIFKVLKV